MPSKVDVRKKDEGGCICSADWHCNSWLEGGEPVNGVNGRLQDFLKAIDFLLNYAIVHKVSRIIQLGDVYHLKKNIPQDAYNLLWQKLYDFVHDSDIENKPTLEFLAGNHDREDDRKEIVTILPYYAFAEVNTEPAIWESGRVVYVPWLYDQARVQKFLKDLPRKEYQMLLFHGELDGAHVGPTDYVLKSKMTDAIIQPKRFGQIFAGHLHRRQHLRGVWYPGSLIPKDFGELETDKGFLHVLPSGEVKVVQIPSPSFLTYAFGRPLVNERQIEKLCGLIRGNLVRIVSNEPLDPAVVRLLEDAGPRYLNLRLARVEREVPVAPQPQSESFDSLVRKYINERQVQSDLAEPYYEYGIATLRRSE